MNAVATIGWGLLGLATLGSFYMLAAAIVLRRFLARPGAAPRRAEAVTLLKPLHGSEPRLGENLASFLAQDHGGPIQMLCGVQRADDPAIAAVRRLEACFPAVALVLDPGRHGANGKVSNLVNLVPRATHPILILSDSDIVVPPGYLACVLAALAMPGVGAVTCLYHGRGDAGFWSRLGAAGLSWQFLPGACFAIATGIARPCMGSTIALTRDTLDRIGGFAAFADVLADDHAIGAAVRRLGLRIVTPPLLVAHGSAEASLADLWRHELRWGATLRGVAPGAYAASLIGLPLPLALLGLLLSPSMAGAGIVLLALAVRLLLVRAVDRLAGAPTAPLWLLPIRDLLSFAVFVASFFAGSVDWRGDRFRRIGKGRIVARPESLP